MKRIILLGLICFSFYNCSNEHLKKDFIGVWDDHPLGFQNQLQFYKDSVVNWSYCRKSVGTWKVSSTQLFLHFPEDRNNPHYSEYSTLDYRFNTAKDSLYLIVENDSLEHLIMKVEDDWSHYLKEYKIKIRVPNANPITSLQMISCNQYPTLYIGWKDNILTVKGDESNSKPLKAKGDYAKSLLNSYMSSEIEGNIHPITLVIDEEVSNAQVDSIKSIINGLNFKDTYYFRVYNLENQELNYGYVNPNCHDDDYWYWYGLYDWNGLDLD